MESSIEIVAQSAATTVNPTPSANPALSAPVIHRGRCWSLINTRDIIVGVYCVGAALCVIGAFTVLANLHNQKGAEVGANICYSGISCIGGAILGSMVYQILPRRA